MSGTNSIGPRPPTKNSDRHGSPAGELGNPHATYRRAAPKKGGDRSLPFARGRIGHRDDQIGHSAAKADAGEEANSDQRADVPRGEREQGRQTKGEDRTHQYLNRPEVRGEAHRDRRSEEQTPQARAKQYPGLTRAQAELPNQGRRGHADGLDIESLENRGREASRKGQCGCRSRSVLTHCYASVHLKRIGMAPR